MRHDDVLTAVDLIQQAIDIDPAAAENHDLLGTALRNQGEFARANECYQRAIQLSPDRAEGHANLGACLFDQGHVAEAVACCERAIELDSELAAAHYNLGNALQVQRRFTDAGKCYETALRIDPNYGQAHANLGALRFAENQLDAAHRHYVKALELLPKSADVHNNLGAVKHQQGDVTAAIALYQTAIGLKPKYVDAIANLAEAFIDQGEHAEAIACYKTLRDLEPDAPEVHNNLGVAMQLERRLVEAVLAHERALELQPLYAEAFTNLGTALRDLNELSRAEAAYREAIRLQNDLVEAHVGLANVLEDSQRFEDALVSYDDAIEIAPDDPEARFARSLALLRRGDFANGWREYDWRWKTKAFHMPDFAAPLWKGEPLCDRMILIHAEQGLGDTIQFMRYLPLVQAAGGNVIFAVDSRLRRLMANASGVDRLAMLGDELPRFDLHAPLLSLPRIFETMLDNIPAAEPYLYADEQLVSDWRDRLSAVLNPVRGLRVGVCWQGNSDHRRDRARSIPFEFIQHLANVSDLTLVSLQRRAAESTPPDEAAESRILDFGDSLDQHAGPFMDTAAIMMNLDLVVSCDTAIAHLAGALGVPVWLALDHAADWRWMRERDDSPWYPAMRLFRQGTPSDWSGVIAEIRSALREQPVAESQTPRGS